MTSLSYIPYFETSRYKVQTMLDLANPKKGEKMIDLGSGDGRIVIAFAAKGIQATGYELDKQYVSESLQNISRANASYASIVQQDFWEVDLSSYDIITIYPMPDIMGKLSKKLEKEAKKDARIILNYYELPNWQLQKMKNNIYLYIKK